jgi:predicted enzyme related to lactoylglutathione lyase
VDLSGLEAWVLEPFPQFSDGYPTRIPVTDLNRAISFCVDILQWKIKNETDQEVTVENQAGFQSRLKVACRGLLPEGIRLPWTHTVVYTSGLRKMNGYLEKAGVAFDKPYTVDSEGRASFVIKDPDGNEIAFSGPEEIVKE